MDPRNQTFVIAGSNGVANTTIWMAAIDQRRVALANVCISYGVQLGLSFLLHVWIESHRQEESLNGREHLRSYRQQVSSQYRSWQNNEAHSIRASYSNESVLEV